MGKYTCPVAQAKEHGIILDSSVSPPAVHLLLNSHGCPSKLCSASKPLPTSGTTTLSKPPPFPWVTVAASNLFPWVSNYLLLTPSISSQIINKNKYFPQCFIMKVFKPTSKKKMFTMNPHIYVPIIP